MQDPNQGIEEVSADDKRGNTRLIPWFGLIIAVLLSGSIGFLIGRQSGEADASELAALGEAAVATVVVRPDEEDISVSAPEVPTPVSISAETTTTMGDPNAPVTIVEYTDYQCPYCQRNFQQTWPQLKAEYVDTGRVFYVFKDFPLNSIHPQAAEAAQAAHDALAALV